MNAFRHTIPFPSISHPPTSPFRQTDCLRPHSNDVSIAESASAGGARGKGAAPHSQHFPLIQFLFFVDFCVIRFAITCVTSDVLYIVHSAQCSNINDILFCWMLFAFRTPLYACRVPHACSATTCATQPHNRVWVPRKSWFIYIYMLRAMTSMREDSDNSYPRWARAHPCMFISLIYVDSLKLFVSRISSTLCTMQDTGREHTASTACRH